MKNSLQLALHTGVDHRMTQMLLQQPYTNRWINKQWNITTVNKQNFRKPVPNVFTLGDAKTRGSQLAGDQVLTNRTRSSFLLFVTEAFARLCSLVHTGSL